MRSQGSISQLCLWLLEIIYFEKAEGHFGCASSINFGLMRETAGIPPKNHERKEARKYVGKQQWIEYFITFLAIFLPIT